MNKKIVGLKDIAESLNLSINTCSHALRDLNDISLETKEKVLAKAKELGYLYINKTERYIKKRKVIFLVKDFSNLYYHILSNNLFDLFNKDNKVSFLVLCINKTKIDKISVNEILDNKPNLVLSHIEFDEEAIKSLNDHKIKLVLIGNNSLKDIDSICIDESAGCEMAARYLARFHQTKKFLYVGIKDYPLSIKRYQYFYNYLKQVCEDGTIETFYFDGHNATTFYKYIKEGYRSVFFFNDELAYNVLSETNRIYLNIRRLFPDLHLIGFDCLYSKINGLNDITSIQINYEDFALKTFKIIKAKLFNDFKNIDHIVLPITLHQRRVLKE